MLRTEDLTEPAVVGEKYLVPTAKGEYVLSLSNRVWPDDFMWPILLPPHEDVYYARLVYARDRGYSVEDDGKIMKDHLHIDERFLPEEIAHSLLPPMFPQPTKVILVIDPNDGVIVWQELTCLRQFWLRRTIFSKTFVDDHTGKKAVCRRCPHRGALLASSQPDAEGIVTCPMHGLKFTNTNGELVCIGG